VGATLVSEVDGEEIELPPSGSNLQDLGDFKSLNFYAVRDGEKIAYLGGYIRDEVLAVTNFYGDWNKVETWDVRITTSVEAEKGTVYTYRVPESATRAFPMIVFTVDQDLSRLKSFSYDVRVTADATATSTITESDLLYFLPNLPGSAEDRGDSYALTSALIGANGLSIADGWQNIQLTGLSGTGTVKNDKYAIIDNGDGTYSICLTFINRWNAASGSSPKNFNLSITSLQFEFEEEVEPAGNVIWNSEEASLNTVTATDTNGAHNFSTVTDAEKGSVLSMNAVVGTFVKIQVTTQTDLTKAKAISFYESCKRCDYTTYQEIPALGHAAEVVEGYAATCTDEGKTDGEKCSVCNDELIVQKSIAALGHNDENKDNVCDRCDEKLTATAGMLLMPVVKGESMAGNWYRIYRAESGYDVGSLYTTNGLGLLANSVSYGYNDAYLFHSGPLATLDGLEVVYTDEYIDVHFVCGTYTIIRNGIVTSEIVTLDENVKVSSASQNVFRLVDEKHCESNGLTHNLKLVEGYAATCTETGVADIEKCSNCGASSTRPETIPTVAHTEVIVNKVDASCLSYGSTERTECSICGTVVEDSKIIVPTGHTNNNGDEACDICGMKVKDADAITDHSDFVEVAVAKGDFVAGKWYRIYRDESTPGCYIDLSTDKNNGYLVAYRSNSSYENATYFYSGPLYIIKGMKFVYTDEYIDFYLEEGVYEIMHHTTGASTGLKLTINETTTITGFTPGKCFELKQEI